MRIHAKISPTRRTWCFTSHYDQGDRESKDIQRGIFTFTLLNFPEGTLFNRVNPIRAGIVSTLAELNEYAYSGHSVLMGRK